MAAAQRRHGLAAAFKGDEAHFLEIHAGRLGGQRGLHPVLAAHGTACAQHDLGRILLEGFHQAFQVGVRGIVANHRNTVVRADSGQPAHVVDVVLAELALGKVQQRTARKRHDGARLVGMLGHDVVVGHGADAAGHVDDAHGGLERAALLQAFRGQAAGQVETPAGLGRRDAFRAAGLFGSLGGAQGQGNRAKRRNGGQAQLQTRLHSCVSEIYRSRYGWKPRPDGFPQWLPQWTQPYKIEAFQYLSKAVDLMTHRSIRR
ncbi:hypothetical protein D9M68_645040 [compost metagenome]